MTTVPRTGFQSALEANTLKPSNLQVGPVLNPPFRGQFCSHTPAFSVNEKPGLLPGFQYLQPSAGSSECKKPGGWRGAQPRGLVQSSTSGDATFRPAAETAPSSTIVAAMPPSLQHRGRRYLPRNSPRESFLAVLADPGECNPKTKAKLGGAFAGPDRTEQRCAFRHSANQPQAEQPSQRMQGNLMHAGQSRHRPGSRRNACEHVHCSLGLLVLQRERFP